MTEQTSLDYALSAIRDHRTGDALAVMLQQDPLLNQRGPLLSEALRQGRPASAFVLLEANCADADKIHALKEFCAEPDAKGKANVARGLSAALVLDRGVSDLRVVNKSIDAIAALTKMKPNVLYNLWKTGVEHRQLEMHPLTQIPSPGVAGRLLLQLEKLFPVEHQTPTRNIAAVMKYNYPLYTTMAEMGGGYLPTALNPPQVPHLWRLLQYVGRSPLKALDEPRG